MVFDKDNISDGNKLIAEFMGFEYIPFNNNYEIDPGWWKKNTPKAFRGKSDIASKVDKKWFLCRNHNQLRYFNSWDWLMEVVEKFESMGYDTSLKTHYVRLNPSPSEAYYNTIAYVSFNSDGYNIFRCMPNDDEYDGHVELGGSRTEGINKKQAIWLMVVESIKWVNENK